MAKQTSPANNSNMVIIYLLFNAEQ